MVPCSLQISEQFASLGQSARGLTKLQQYVDLSYWFQVHSVNKMIQFDPACYLYVFRLWIALSSVYRIHYGAEIFRDELVFSRLLQLRKCLFPLVRFASINHFVVLVLLK